MANHTIGNKRGSVRGAPPSVYAPFTSFHASDEDEDEAFKPVIAFFGGLVKGIVGYVILIVLLVVWYALGEPDY